jgi:hypothetical protein
MRFPPRAVDRSRFGTACLALIATVVVLGLPAGSDATTYTVTNTNDSGPESLREALANANANVGLDSVVFNIPGAPPHSIRPDSMLPTITDAVVIDGWSQPGYAGTPCIELDGSNVGIGNLDGVRIWAWGCTVRGLVVNRFPDMGISLYTGGGHTIQGNYVGTDVTGTIALPNAWDGITINACGDNTIGGATPETRNVFSGNARTGVALVASQSGTVNNLVIGNYIGLDATGSAALGNGIDGVFIGHTASENTIGGTAPGEGNVIVDNARWGVRIEDSSWGNHVLGNYIGTDASGTIAMGNAWAGVSLSGPGANSVGGTAPGAANVTAYNGQDGVRVEQGTGNTISCNAIFSNGGLGIDLGTNGVTPNDPGDGDSGPNGLQNFPVVVSVASGGGVTTIQGVLDSTPSNAFYLEFFSSPQSDPTGYGEGSIYLGGTTVVTDASGTAAFTVQLTGDVPLGHVVAATATDPGGNTSEFGPVGTVVAVELTSFTAESRGGVVRLTWRTLTEQSNVGFHLYRSFKQSANYRRITDNLIPGAGTTSEPHSYSYTDRAVEGGTTYFYKVADVDVTGAETMHGPVGVAVPPADRALQHSSPNPFTASTTLRVSLAAGGHVRLEMYNLTGERVRTLHDGMLAAGLYEMVWDGRDELGRDVPPGAYVCQVRVTSSSAAGLKRYEQSRMVVLTR